MSEQSAETDAPRCGPCRRGQHGCCDGGTYVLCECCGVAAGRTADYDAAREPSWKRMSKREMRDYIDMMDANFQNMLAAYRDADARATALAEKIDRCTDHLRVALGYPSDARDTGLEALAVQARRGYVFPPGTV